MKKDIEIPIVKDVHVAMMYEWDEKFTGQDWNAYLINNKNTDIEMVLIVSKGADGDKKTSTMRHSKALVKAKSYTKIEVVPDNLLQLDNVFDVTFFEGNKLFEKRYIFEKNSISEKNQAFIPVLEKEGVLAT